MIVQVLNRGFDYEGETTLGVYADRSSAIAVAREEALRCGHINAPEELVPRQDVRGEEFWARDASDSTQWYIRSFEVK